MLQSAPAISQAPFPFTQIIGDCGQMPESTAGPPPIVPQLEAGESAFADLDGVVQLATTMYIWARQDSANALISCIPAAEAIFAASWQ